MNIPATSGLVASQLQAHQKICREYRKTRKTNQLFPFFTHE